MKPQACWPTVNERRFLNTNDPCLPPTERHVKRMPPAIGAIVAAFGAVGIGISATTATMILMTAIGIAISFVSRLLMGKPRIPDFNQETKGRQFTVRQPNAPWRIVYGSVGSLGGIMTYLDKRGTNGEWLDMVITLACHQVQSISNPYFDGVEVPLDGSGDATEAKWAGFVHVEKKLGAPGEAAFPGLVSVSGGKWTANHLQAGRASVYVRLKYDADKFANGVPNITFTIEGKPIYDPRNSPATTGYSPNAALCIRDYLQNYVGATDAEIDDDAIIAAANICAETVTQAGSPSTTRNRYRCDGTIELGRGWDTDLNELLTSCAGYLNTTGRYSLLVGAWRAPSLSLSENDLRGPVQVQALVSRRDLFNSVKGQYVGPATKWQPSDYPAVSNSTYVTQDGGEVFWDDAKFPFTTTPGACQQLSNIHLERVRRQITVILPCKMKAWACVPGDVISLSYDRYSWTNKTFEIVESKFVIEEGTDDNKAPTIGVDLTLRETDSDVYTWTTAQEQVVGTVSALNLPTASSGAGTLSPAVPINTGNYAVVDSIDAGTTATIQIHGSGGTTTNYNRVVGGVTVERPYGTITGKAFATPYYVVYDGSAYLAFTSFAESVLDSYEPVGRVTTVADGGGGGTTGGGGSGGGSGCVEVGTEVIEPEGTTQEFVPCDEWVTLAFDGDSDPLKMHPSTLVKVWKRADELTPQDRIGVNGGSYRVGAVLGYERHNGLKVVRRCPGCEYSARTGDAWVELHNKYLP